MYDHQKAERVLERIKQRAAAGNYPRRISIYRGDISSVLKPLQSLAQFSEMAWQIQQAQIIEVKPISEVISTARDRYRAKCNANWKECYFNAVKVSRKLGAAYCEGWFISPTTGGLTRHAWNRLNGLFFDVTGELYFDDFEDCLYVLSFETDSQTAQELWKYAKNHFFGNPLLATAYWRRKWDKAKSKQVAEKTANAG